MEKVFISEIQAQAINQDFFREKIATNKDL